MLFPKVNCNAPRAQLTKARIALEQARNDEGMLSAQATADAISTLITTARGDLLKLQEEFETQKHYVSETAPQMLNLRTASPLLQIKSRCFNRNSLNQMPATAPRGCSLER